MIKEGMKGGEERRGRVEKKGIEKEQKKGK